MGLGVRQTWVQISAWPSYLTCVYSVSPPRRQEERRLVPVAAVRIKYYLAFLFNAVLFFILLLLVSLYLVSCFSALVS